MQSNHCSFPHPPLNAAHHAACRQRAVRGHDTGQSRRITWRERARRAEGREGPRSPEGRNEREKERRETRTRREEGDPARASGRSLGPRVPRHGLVSLFGLHGQRSSSSTSHLRVLNLLSLARARELPTPRRINRVINDRSRPMCLARLDGGSTRLEIRGARN